jgi:hypothetical protein
MLGVFYMRAYFLSYLFLAFCCVLSFGAKLESSDTELATKLIGTWTLSPTDPLTNKLSGDVTYKSDSSYEGVIFIKHSGETTRWEFAGNWKIEKSRLISTSTKTNIPDLGPVGKVDSVRIDHITEKELVLVQDDGKLLTRIRK